MKNAIMKKSLCLFLAILTLAFCAFGCRKGKGEETTQPEGGAAAGYDQSASFAVANLSQAVIVYSKSGGTKVSEIANALRGELNAVFDAGIKTKDETSDSDAAYEIVVGKTNRTAGADIISTLRADDTTMGVVGNTLLLVGGSAESTSALVNEFIKKVKEMNASAETLFSNADAQTVYADTVFPHADVKLNGAALGDYTIVYPAKSGFDTQKSETAEKKAATLMQERIKAATGFELRVATDNATETACEILVGKTNRKASDVLEGALTKLGSEDVYVNGNGTKIVLGAVTFAGMVNAGLSFVDNHINKEVDGKALDITIGEAQKYDETSLIRVLDWNVYHHGYAGTGAVPPPTDKHGWNTKKCMEMVVEQVETLKPDVFITQETVDFWVIYLMQQIGDEYEWAYTRSSGYTADESHNAIFYRKDKLNLIDNGMFWPSPTPTKFSYFDFTPTSATSGNKLNGLATPRLATWAKFEVKASGQKFMAMSCHLDLFGDAEKGALRGENQMKVIAEFIKKNADYPVIIGGDFNSRKTNTQKAMTPYEVLSGTPRMAEASTVALKATTGQEIDWVFVSKDSIEVLTYQNIAVRKITTNGVTAQDSDHPAQFVTMYLK